MTEKIKLWNSKQALRNVNDDAMVAQTFQVLKVFLGAGASNQEVVNVCITEVKTSENFVDEPLKSAFWRPKGMRVNSNSPKGVVTAVLHGYVLGCNRECSNQVDV